MSPDFTLGNALTLIMMVATAIAGLVRFRLEISAIKIQHDAEIKSLEKDIATIKLEQHEMYETSRRTFSAISDLKDSLGNALQDIRDRLTRIEAQNGIARRRQDDSY